MVGDGSVSARRAAGTLRRSLWYVEPGRVDLSSEEIGPAGPGEASVRTMWSAVSRGTERLVAEGRVPVSEHARMRAPRQGGNFPFPVKYGYAAVGEIVDGPASLAGRVVFCLNPHEDAFVAPVEALVPVPEIVPPRRATLAANMETALNGVWDGAVGPGDRVVVVGGGVIGILVAFVAAGIPGTAVTLVEIDEARRRLAGRAGLRAVAEVDDPGGADVVFHASASAGGLAAAIEAAAFEARVVEMSWYGEGTVAAPLGGAFHANRLILVASQVGSVPAGRRARISHRRRLELAVSLLADDRLDALLEPEIAFEEAPSRLPSLLAGTTGGAIVLRYGTTEPPPPSSAIA